MRVAAIAGAPAKKAADDLKNFRRFDSSIIALLLGLIRHYIEIDLLVRFSGFPMD
jgi:ABC-type transporter Mla MlaB component